MNKKTDNSIRSAIIGAGACLPEKILTNADLEKIVDTSDEWIVQRSGIKERRIASEGESTITFASGASRKALVAANIQPEELGLIIVGTQTPDMVLPSTACLLQNELGAFSAIPFDLVAGCTGWIYGLVTADQFIRNNPCMKVLVVGAEILSRSLNWEDRSTCVLFGDGAGAVVMESRKEGGGLLSTCLAANGAHWETLTMKGGGSMYPPSHEMVDQKLHTVYMEGNKIFKIGIEAMVDVCWQVLSDAGLAPAEVDWFVPHQANLRMMEGVATRMGIPREKVVVTVDRYGNNSTATIPVALAESVEEGKIKKGDHVLMVSFGGGLTWGAVLVQW